MHVCFGPNPGAMSKHCFSFPLVFVLFVLCRMFKWWALNVKFPRVILIPAFHRFGAFAQYGATFVFLSTALR